MKNAPNNLAAWLEHGAHGIYQQYPLNVAREEWADTRAKFGRKHDRTAPLLTAPDGNAKISKTTLPTYSLALRAGKYGGKFNVCPNAGQCETSCLGTTAGRNVFTETRTAQEMRTHFLAERPNAFLAILQDELWRALMKRQRDVGPNARIACRLNAYSDIAWETVAPWLFDLPVVFYDYTKRDPRVRKPPANYHLTWSADERTTSDQISDHLTNGRNVAVVGVRRKGEALPPCQHHIIDGDNSDSRYNDPAGVIVHLSRKGNALPATSPFLRDDLL